MTTPDYQLIGLYTHANRNELREHSAAICSGANLARKLLTEIEIAQDQEEPLQFSLNELSALLGLMAGTASSMHRRLTDILGEDDDDPPEQHRVSVPLTEDERAVAEQAAAAAGKTTDELLTDLIRERIQRAADRIGKEGE